MKFVQIGSHIFATKSIRKIFLETTPDFAAIFVEYEGGSICALDSKNKQSSVEKVIELFLVVSEVLCR